MECRGPGRKPATPASRSQPGATRAACRREYAWSLSRLAPEGDLGGPAFALATLEGGPERRRRLVRLQCRAVAPDLVPQEVVGALHRAIQVVADGAVFGPGRRGERQQVPLEHLPLPREPMDEGE